MAFFHKELWEYEETIYWKERKMIKSVKNIPDYMFKWSLQRDNESKFGKKKLKNIVVNLFKISGYIFEIIFKTPQKIS